MSSLKKVALYLHGLNVKDRDWLLSHLPTEYLFSIKKLLRELKELGIPSDSQTQEFFSRLNASRTTESNLVEKIDKVDAIQVCRALVNHRPDALALLLSLYPWFWRDDFYHRYAKKHGERARRALRKNVQETAVEKSIRIELMSVFLEVLDNEIDSDTTDVNCRPESFVKIDLDEENPGWIEWEDAVAENRNAKEFSEGSSESLDNSDEPTILMNPVDAKEDSSEFSTRITDSNKAEVKDEIEEDQLESLPLLKEKNMLWQR